MQLTQHTDYGIRALIMIALAAPERVTVAQLGGAYGLSEHHLLKIVGRLAKLGYVETTRGKAGGVRLAREPSDIDLGQLVRELESELGVVACLRTGEQLCTIDGACALRGVLRDATEEFLSTLSRYTLADVIAPRAKLERLLQLRR